MEIRPPDFDEDGIRKFLTFRKWLELGEGENIKYACRTFVKGHQNDEEWLMRRIMIARRNNVRYREILKIARGAVVKKDSEDATKSASFVAKVAAVAAAITANESIRLPPRQKTIQRRRPYAATVQKALKAPAVSKKSYVRKHITNSKHTNKKSATVATGEKALKSSVPAKRPIKIKNDMDSENRGQTVGCNAKKPRKELAAAKVGNFLLSSKKNGSTELLKWFRLDN